MIKHLPRDVWAEYQRGVDYNTAIDLYETVRVNRNFFLGKQWEGLHAPDLPKPVMNIMKRVISYQTSMITSDDVGVSFTPFRKTRDAELIASVFASEVERVLEQAKIKELHRDAIRNASVDGDACLYLYFDPEVETGQEAKGDIRCELLDNINVYFGNPYLNNAQKQPYIILAQRKTVREVKEEAKANGVPEAEYASITADRDPNQGEAGDDNDLTTLLTKFWREEGTVFAVKVTETVTVREKWDTGLTLYPIAWMPWETVRASYHGQASITGLIPNQIAINRLYAMLIRSVEMNAFPKLVYDSSKILQWSNKVGEAIAVTGGGVTDAIATAVRGADVSPQVMQVIESTVTMTRDFMGASDAARPARPAKARVSRLGGGICAHHRGPHARLLWRAHGDAHRSRPDRGVCGRGSNNGRNAGFFGNHGGFRANGGCEHALEGRCWLRRLLERDRADADAR